MVPLQIDSDNLLENNKAIWIKTEDLKNTKWHALPVYDERCVKTKIGTYGDKFYTNFWGLDVPEDGVERKHLIVISINLLIVLWQQILLANIFRQWCL